MSSQAPLCAAGRRSKAALSFAVIALILMCCSVAQAQQSGFSYTTIATDQTASLNLSGSFGVPRATAIDSAGDLAFIGRNGGSLFFRARGSASIQLLLQNGDPVPGIAGGRIASFLPAVFDSQAGVLFGVNFYTNDGVTHVAILTGSPATNSYAKVAADEDIAPPANGIPAQPYGTGLTPLSINDNGDVAFNTSLLGLTQAVFMIPSGGVPIRLIGQGESVPGSLFGELFLDGPNTRLNASGEMLLSVLPSGVLFVSKIGQVIVLPGGCASGNPAFFGSVSRSGLNNSHVAVFTELRSGGSGICYLTVGAVGPSTVALSGDAAPVTIGGTLGDLSSSNVFIADSGDIYFTAPINNSTITTSALLHFDPSSHLIAEVAHVGQLEPSGSGNTFSGFKGISASIDGTIDFVASFMQGGAGVFQKTPSGQLTLIARQGSPSPVGGTLDLSQASNIDILSDHSAFFLSQISGGAAHFAEVLAQPGMPTQSLLSSADLLPSAARPQLNAGPAAGSFVGFSALRAGGQMSLFVATTSSGVNITKISTEGDPAPSGLGTFSGFTIFNQTLSAPFFLNANGKIAFQSNISSTTSGASSHLGIFAGTSSANLSKIVATGDPAPGTSSTFSLLEFGQFGFASVAPLLNNNGQLAFFSFLANGTQGVFRADSDGSIHKIVMTGDPGPLGGTFSRISSQVVLSQLGHVAFQAAANNASGAYDGDGNSVPQPIVQSGDHFAGSSTTLLNTNGLIGLSDSGVLTFLGNGQGGPDAGFLIGSGLAPDISAPLAIAAASTAAPGGGGFVFELAVAPNAFTSVLGLAWSNPQNDLAFWSLLTPNAFSTSGYFINRGVGPQPGVLQPLLMQGQAAPGGGTFDFVSPPGTPGTGSALSADGQFLTLQRFTAGNASRIGLFVAGRDGSLRYLLAAGDSSPDGVIGGSIYGLQITPGLAAAGGTTGNFAFWTGISNGSASQAILVSRAVSGNSSITLTSSQNPSSLGQAVTFTATVTSPVAGVPSGTVTFSDGGTPLVGSPVPLSASGVATLTPPVLSGGPHSITASYSGDSTFNPATSGSLPQTVIRATSSTAIASSGSPTNAGQPVTFTATVTSTTPGPLTGTVTFFENGPLGPAVPLDNNHQAVFTTANLSPGFHSISAEYSGDTNFQPSSNFVSQTVIATSTTTLVSSANPSVPGQSVTFTATVASNAPNPAIGQINFFDGATLLSPGTVINGTATFTTSGFGPGSHSITAQFMGDFETSPSTSNPLTQVVKQLSSISISSSSNPVPADQVFTLTATVSGSGGTPTGTVAFFDGTFQLPLLNQPVLNSSGVATAQTSISIPGSHSITAHYSGDSGFAAVTSAPLTEQVNRAPSSVVVASSQNPASVGQSITFTATVAPSNSSGFTLTSSTKDSVTFFDGSTSLGTLPLNSIPGQATLTTSSLTAGSHSITAQYNGDLIFLPSVSTAITQQVNPPGFSVTASPSSLTITAGQSGKIVLTVTPVGGSTQTVSFNCTGLPPSATCQGTPPSVTLDGVNASTDTITIQTTARSTGMPPTPTRPTLPSQQMFELVVSMSGLLYSLVLLRRRRVVSFAACMLLATVFFVAGCGGGAGSTAAPGGGTTTGTPAGSYTTSVVVSAGSASNSVPISITIQ